MNITLIGRTVTVEIDGKGVFSSTQTYGYDQQFEQTGLNWPQENGHINREKYDYGGYEPMWQYVERTVGLTYSAHVSDVARKSDL